MKEYSRNEERTGVQEAAAFSREFDVQSDFVMVYGFHDLKNRIAKWKKRGYVIHLMTGVSWGEYQDYLYGRFDGIDHHDEGQLRRNGSDISPRQGCSVHGSVKLIRALPRFKPEKGSRLRC